MSTSPCHRAGRLGIVSMLAAAMAISAPSAGAQDTGVEILPPAPARNAHAAGKPHAGPKEADHVELERLNRQTASAEAPKEAPAATTATPVGNGQATEVQPPHADVVNAFATTSWYVPPPPAKPEPPPKPTAPPLPFAFLGRYEDPARTSVVVMLSKGDRLYTVSEGDVIDDTYRVDRITDKTVELTYLPLQTKQSLQTGGT